MWCRLFGHAHDKPILKYDGGNNSLLCRRCHMIIGRRLFYTSGKAALDMFDREAVRARNWVTGHWPKW